MERAGTGLPLVSLFDFDGAQVGRFVVLMYERPDLSWLAYVADNRRGCRSRDDWDLVVGPVAGEQSMPALALYLWGYLTAEVALGMLSTRCLCRQYCFKTQSALDCLTYRETIAV